MVEGGMFCALSSADMASVVRDAKQTICFAGPGIHLPVAQAMRDAISRLGPEMITMCLDFDERVMRMGYGSIEAVAFLRDAGISVRSASGMRTGFHKPRLRGLGRSRLRLRQQQRKVRQGTAAA